MTPKSFWIPNPERVVVATLTEFARKRSLPESYPALWEWSVDHLDEFWAAIWDEWVDADAPYACVLASRQMPGAEWSRARA
jgi:acetoacetyl-CoA synthetase